MYNAYIKFKGDAMSNFAEVVYTTTTTTSSGGGAAFGVLMLIYFAVIIIAIVALWKVFVKAGQPGWGAIIPIYNVYLLLKIAGRPGWWLILFFIPFVNIVVSLVVSIDVAKNFGQGTLFGVVALWFFSIIGYLILGFGDAKYVGPGGSTPAAAGPAPVQSAGPPAGPTQPPVVQ